jgi:hypothetical protein
MPGTQPCIWQDLKIVVKSNVERGLYFTDEFLDLTFELYNIGNERLKGCFTVFYGFGSSGLEGKTSDIIEFDIEPKNIQEKKALHKLVGIQGNGIIAMITDVESILGKEQVTYIKGSNSPESPFATLYTFVTMEREFYKRFYERPEKLMESTKTLTKRVVVLTVVVCVLTAASIIIALLEAYHIFPIPP